MLDLLEAWTKAPSPKLAEEEVLAGEAHGLWPPCTAPATRAPPFCRLTSANFPKTRVRLPNRRSRRGGDHPGLGRGPGRDLYAASSSIRQCSYRHWKSRAKRLQGCLHAAGSSAATLPRSARSANSFARWAVRASVGGTFGEPLLNVHCGPATDQLRTNRSHCGTARNWLEIS